MTFAAAAERYDRFMGRYTPLLATEMADRVGVVAGMRVVDVGCGPGGLVSELCSRAGASNVAGLDPAPQFVAACSARNPGADIRVGTAEDLPWVFEEFRQVGDPHRRRGGSGLGLAVTRHFVEMHGGNIWVESAVGNGSVFHFTMPLQEQVVSVAASPDWNRLVGAGSANANCCRVLMIAEPESEPHRLFRSYLDGYEVVAAADLDEAECLAQQSDVCALVLIDYQQEQFDGIRSETSADLVELHVRLLAKTAKAFDVPIVLTTVGVAYGLNHPTLPSIQSELEDIEAIDRSSMNAFEDQAFREAVEATGRKRLIIGGLHTEICLTFSSVQALKDGYDVMFVTDAVGGRSQASHRTGIERLAAAGAVPTTTLAVTTELFRDWAGPLAGAARDVIYWYFREVPKVTDRVGIAESEKLAAAGEPAR